MQYIEVRDDVSGTDRPVENAKQAAPDPTRAVMVEVTPSLAFAAAALAVSVLALAVVLGKRWGEGTALDRPPAMSDEPQTLSQVRRALPLRYDQLQVDRGISKSNDP